MQEEVTKHTRKIFKIFRAPGHGFWSKFNEILVEIFIIVFAVSLSIWFHGWSDHRHEQKEVKGFLQGLKNDLTADIKLLEDNRAAIAGLNMSYSYLLSLGSEKAAPDTQVYRHLYFDLRVTRPNIGRYEGFKSSGKIGTIENEALKQNILIFYEQTIPDLVYGENFVNALQTKILDMQVERGDILQATKFVNTAKMKSLLNLGNQNFTFNLSAYDKAIRQAKEIITEIEKTHN